MKTLMITLGIIASCTLTAQVAINNDGTTPDPSAMLEVKSTNKGFLPPRMTTAQIDSISYPAEGLIVYNTDNETLMVFNGVLWKSPIAGFVCGDQVMDADSNIYNTIIIGSQCWMKENLKTTTYRNGTSIPNVTDNTAWTSLTTGAYCWHNNDSATWAESYGAMYNWHAAVDANGLCPAGWHAPTNLEWTALTDYIGGISSPHGNELKSCRQVNSPLGGSCNTTEHPRWNEHSTHYGTDDYGFSGLPGGVRSADGVFGNIGSMGSWWSSTENTSTIALSRTLSVGIGSALVTSSDKRYGESVRCLRD